MVFSQFLVQNITANLFCAVDPTGGALSVMVWLLLTRVINN
jgi:hypothetical protein